MTLTSRSTLPTAAAAVGDALRRSRLRMILTGGACAHIYSGGVYESLDIDFVLGADARRDAIDRAMATVGYVRDGDHYVHPRARFYVELLRGPLAVGGDTSLRPVLLRIGRLRTLALSATDSCRDRLAAFYHWSDRQSLAAAVAIARRHPVNMALLARWSRAERQSDRFEEFVTEVGTHRRRAARQ